VDQQALWERAERLRGAADEAARLAQNVYLSFLLFGTYIAVIIWSTKDVQLLKASPVTLPLLNVPLPIVGFYIVAPWLLLLIYFNVLLHLTFLAQRLHQFNSVLVAFPDAIMREEQRARLFPFPFSAMLIGRSPRRRLRILLGLMVSTTVVLLPLILLLWAQVRFLPYHDTSITWSHRAAVLMDLILLWLFRPLMLLPVHRTASIAPSHRLWRVVKHIPLARRVKHIPSARRFLWGAGLVLLSFVTVVSSLGIAVLPEEATEVGIASHVPTSWLSSEPRRDRKPIFILTYWVFETPSSPFHRNLRLREQVLVAGEPSSEIIAALYSMDETKRVQGLEKITGLPLTNRDLRGADLSFTLFPKADLRGTNLKGADLTRAKMFASSLLSETSRVGQPCGGTVQHVVSTPSSPPSAWTVGDRCGGTFQQAVSYNKCVTNLQGADLLGVELQGADLRGAQLQGAFLEQAQLQGADLRDAQLQGAFLRDAQLQGADLWLADLRGADLEETQLQGADLGQAKLQGAVLCLADLQGADLGQAQLQGADLWPAQLQGADLRAAQVGSANFTEADLTLSNLQGLSWSPLLDETMYQELESILNPAIPNQRRRIARLTQIKAAIGRDLQLNGVSAKQVLCDDVNLFPSCLTQENTAEYVDALAAFLVTLGCHDGVIARSVLTQIWPRSIRPPSSPMAPDYPLLIAFAKHVTTRPEKDCPVWAALPADKKDSLRKLAAEETADALAAFLVTLDCDNGVIVDSVLKQLWPRSLWPPSSPMSLDYPLLIAFAKHVTARLEKDCPWWAALSADEKDYFRKLAAEKTSPR